MSEPWFMSAPCKHCPFRRDVRPFLHPSRAEDIAYSALNPYSDFSCHKTIEHDDEGESFTTAKSMTCAGFLSMRCSELDDEPPDGFVPSDEIYQDVYEMVDAYEEAWAKERRA